MNTSKMINAKQMIISNNSYIELLSESQQDQEDNSELIEALESQNKDCRETLRSFGIFAI